MMGVEKTPHCLKGFMCDILKYAEDHIYMFNILQNHVAPASYWRDKTSQSSFVKYKKDSEFLAPINNEIQHAKSSQYKERFSALNRLILISFTSDTMIYPF